LGALAAYCLLNRLPNTTGIGITIPTVTAVVEIDKPCIASVARRGRRRPIIVRNYIHKPLFDSGIDLASITDTMELVEVWESPVGVTAQISKIAV